MAVPCTRRLLLIGLLLVLAADIAFGHFLPAAVEQHDLRFKRAADDIFLRDTKDWSKYGIAAGVYLVVSLVLYVATFCCALEKKCAAAKFPPPSSSQATISPVPSMASTANAQSEASMRTALQQSIRMDSRTQRETERAAASSRKSGKVSPSTRLPTASAEEQTASRKTTPARTSSARTASAGTTSKKSTSKATKSKKGNSSKGTTDTGKSTSGSARSTSGGSGKAAANHLVPVPSTPKLPVALPAVRMRVRLAVDLIVLVEKDRRKRMDG
uniref:Transmembrane protein n=1 Tax=Meloidogyne javanica TaxID=6303 RepID=A0A915NA92_MELJA